MSLSFSLQKVSQNASNILRFNNPIINSSNFLPEDNFPIAVLRESRHLQTSKQETYKQTQIPQTKKALYF